MNPGSTTTAHKHLDSGNIVRVALPIPLPFLFDYCLDEERQGPEAVLSTKSRSSIVGRCVVVPFGTREMVGVVCEQTSSTETPVEKLKRVVRTLSEPCVSPEILRLCYWLSDYYAHPIGECVLAAIPPYFRSEKELPKEKYWVHSTEGLGLPKTALSRSKRQQEFHQYLLEHSRCSAAEIKSKGFSSSAVKALCDKGLILQEAEVQDQNKAEGHNAVDLLRELPKIPNDEQSKAIASIRFHEYSCSLLHGITGSGKTEVYLQLSARALERGKQVLVLIPEIGLSPQTVARFKQRFHTPLVELHSEISDKLRAQNWLKAASGSARIIIGTRLAALTPIPQLGLIIIDEEHDSSYKQQESVRYSARDLSIYRARKLKIPMILGSATPSLETLNHALNKRYHHLVMKQRAGEAIPPKIVLVDLKNEALYAGLTLQSLNSIKDTLAQGKQAMVFLNRRGFAPVMLCHACGWMSDCNNCSASMTLHTRPPRLHCHHCDKKQVIPAQCPSCSNPKLETQGLGTEQLEQELNRCLPGSKIIRIDRDTTKSKTAFNQALEQIRSGQPCVLIGTQILAKGHHFPKLNLVVVADADQGFLNPDFRAMEKAGQLLMQVAGRAGRSEQQGQVLVQTHRPEHPLIQTLVHRGYTQFAKHLLNERQISNMPPYWHCAMIRAESKRSENALDLLKRVAALYRSKFPPSSKVSLLGPMPSAMEKVQDRFRFQLLFKADKRIDLKLITNTISKELHKDALAKRVRWSIDIDPIDTA